ncbi:MAG TPA: DNA methyltransferase [Caldilineaceae bacterium]|nr:DNA methyltransferase [Caldilineaceae bacterium]
MSIERELMKYRNQTDDSPGEVDGAEQIGDPSIHQLPLLDAQPTRRREIPYQTALAELLREDLSFHRADTSYASHDFHAFPAKFPPQLPEKFILGLTDPGDLVLDPMMGSGTTILEAILKGRNATGFDIDPLARLIGRVKTTPLEAEQVHHAGQAVIERADKETRDCSAEIVKELDAKWDAATRKFVQYWFARETQIELHALARNIGRVENPDIRAFLELAFSATIITKSGGVSLAFDLAHTRPHRAKVVYAKSGKLVLGEDLAESDNPRIQFLTKTLRSPLHEFRKRLHQNLMSLYELRPDLLSPVIREGNAQSLPLPDASVDLIVTSPPYASHAIDYMRAHKFSLVWVDYAIEELTETRSGYIGGESTNDFDFEELPPYTRQVIGAVEQIDAKRGRVLHRYYSEMARVLREMHRVLRPDKAAVVIVASSIMRGIDTETDKCLSEIGQEVGFAVPQIGVRHLDRNKRMMPAGIKINHQSQIQQRMHEEYVIGFHKVECEGERP